MKLASLWGTINKLFGILQELNVRSASGSVHIEVRVMPNLCPQYLALRGKFTKQNFLFCQLKFQVSIALAKQKYDSWKNKKIKNLKDVRYAEVSGQDIAPSS
jgi:hypothetical protein